MRILIQDYPGYAFPIQLGRELASRGHYVQHVYAGYNKMPRGRIERIDGDPNTFSIRAIYTKDPLQKYSFVKRWLQEREYGKLVALEIEKINPDVVISADTPLDTQSILQKKCIEGNIKFVFWVQDIISIATQVILTKKFIFFGKLLGEYYKILERTLIKKSDQVVVITQDFMPYLSLWGIDTGCIHVIPNWAPIEDIPIRPKQNAWAIEHGIANKLCFLYSGTLGFKHNPNLLLSLAEFYKNSSEICVLVISEGPGANWLYNKRKERQLDNLYLMGYQPIEKFPDVLASGDILVSILNPEAGIFSVPSKVLSYLCANRPLLLSVPPENLAAKIVSQNYAGIVVNPNDQQAFLEAASLLVSDPVLREELSSNASRYAIENFDIRKIADSFERIIST